MNEQNLIFRIIQYGMQKEFFTFEEMNKDLKLTPDEFDFANTKLVHYELESNTINSNHLLSLIRKEYRNVPYQSVDLPKSPLSLLPNALFQYVDYMEIIEARKSAQEAKRLSWYAIWISIGIGLISLVIGTAQLYYQVNAK